MRGLMETETQELTVTTPVELLRLAVTNNADIDKLTKLMELQERWLAAEAKRAFDDAKAQFSSFAVQVTRDKTNKQYDSKYTSLGNLVNTVTPFLARCDLNIRWDIDQSNGIKVTCVLEHKMGHSERVTMLVPPDTSGAKNPIQQIKSAITYAKACTFESVCGLASTDANLDDDANSAYSNGDLAEQLEYIANASSADELKRLYKNAYEMFEAQPNALKQIIEARKTKAKEF